MRDDIVFLVIDDDEIDRTFIKRSFSKNGISNPVEEAADGKEGIAILTRLATATKPAPPVIVLLDINMPRQDGFEFLEEIRIDPRLKGTIVFMLTSSSAPNDVARAYGHQVAGYIVKGDNCTDRGLAALVRAYCALVEFPD